VLDLKPQITPQFVPTSVTGWIQIAAITIPKPRKDLGLLLGFGRALVPVGVLSVMLEP